MDDSFKDFLDEIPEEAYPEKEDEEVVKRAKEMETLLTEEVEEYERTEEDLETLLRKDHVLCKETMELWSFLTLSLAAKEDGEVSEETIETVYLSLVDKYAELSKIFHPLSEMGMDRLWAALSIAEKYEKEYRPLLTQVTANNVEKFGSLLPERFYDDILYDQKSAVGALRYLDGKAYAAGIAVYHFETGAVTELPILRIDHVFVEEDFRQHGVGNHLMARLLGFAAEYPECIVTVSYRPPAHPNEEEAEEEAVIENCLDSWKFDFSMNYGTDFYIRIDDLESNKQIDRGVNEVVSLSTLGEKGQTLVQSFFSAIKDGEDVKPAALPYDYFDPDLSCAILKDGVITHLLLIRSLQSGNMRVVFWESLERSEKEGLVKLLRFAYRTCRTKGKTDVMLSGTFTAEESAGLLQEVLPNAKMMLTFEGTLMKPRLSEDMTTEQWTQLRKLIGLPDVLEETDAPVEKVLGKKGIYEINKALAAVAKNYSDE